MTSRFDDATREQGPARDGQLTIIGLKNEPARDRSHLERLSQVFVEVFAQVDAHLLEMSELCRQLGLSLHARELAAITAPRGPEVRQNGAAGSLTDLAGERKVLAELLGGKHRNVVDVRA